MLIIGIDGCKAGWFLVALSETGWEVGVYPNIKTIWNNYNDASIIIIDIPIGLRDSGTLERLNDIQARKILGPRRSSVFHTPCRQAVYSNDYITASKINGVLTNRRLSKQSWAIIPKIREVDEFLVQSKMALKIIRESHPEVGFYTLNGFQHLKYNKKVDQGYKERIEILRSHYPASDLIINNGLDKYKRKDVTRDDIVDALCLTIIGQRGIINGLKSIPLHAEIDSAGLKMEMIY